MTLLRSVDEANVARIQAVEAGSSYRRAMATLRQLSADLLAGAVRDPMPMAPLFVGEEVAAGTHFVSSFANVTAVVTAEGAVLIDTGSFALAEPTRVILRRDVTTPIHTAIYTHGHVDHCFGVELYEAEPG